MDASAWQIWFLIACIIAALICMAVGAVRAMSAVKRVKARAQTIVPKRLVARALAAKDASEQLQGTLTLTEALLPRASAALDTIAIALRELRGAFALRR